MFIAHYLIPFFAVFIYNYIYEKQKSFRDCIFKCNLIRFENKKIIILGTGIIFFGLLLGNLVDLDHVYMRVAGEVPWNESACSKMGEQCSFEVYPLHSILLMFSYLIFGFVVFSKNKVIKFFGWFFWGAFSNLLLDLIHLKTGIGF